MTSPRVGATETSKNEAGLGRASFSVLYKIKKKEIKEALLAEWCGLSFK